MPRIFITRSIPGPGPDLLHEQGYEVDTHEGSEPLPRAELLKRVKGVDAILCLLTDTIDDAALKAAGPSLRVVANYAVGFDNIDLAAAKKHGVAVTNTPVPEMTESVAEYTIALLLSLARRIPEADAFTRAGRYTGWSPELLLGTDLRKKTLGIVGAGRIGQRVAEIARKGLGMSIVYSSRHAEPELSQALDAAFLPLDQLLQRADVVSVHTPLLPETRHLISTEQFAMMKKTALLLNTARGPIVDEKALLRALKTGRIAGAALDVYEAEPAIDADTSDHLELRALPNVILTPHIASASRETREAMSRLAGANIVAVLSGEPPLTPASVS